MGGLQTYGINHSVYTQLPILRLENNVLSWGTWEEGVVYAVIPSLIRDPI